MLGQIPVKHIEYEQKQRQKKGKRMWRQNGNVNKNLSNNR